MTTRLGRQLYEEDRDAYFETMGNVIQGRTLAVIPTLPRDVAFYLVETVLPAVGLKKALKRWRRGIAESMGIAYVLATEEAWDELDRLEARRLVQDTLTQAISAAHGPPARPAEAIELDASVRVEQLLRGLGSSVPEAAELRDFVFSQGAYQRINEFSDIFQGIGRAVDKVKPRHQGEYDAVAHYGWVLGLHLGFLHIIREI